MLNLIPPVVYFAVPLVTQQASNFNFIWLVSIPAILLLIAGLKLQRKINKYETTMPVIDIKGPFNRQDKVDTNRLPMWYIIVENTKENTCARNTRIHMGGPTPSIVMAFPIVLHQLHNNDRPFQKTHDIRYGEPVKLDLFACGQNNPEMYYLYRADGDESSQIGPEWMLSEDDNAIIYEASNSNEGWRFEVIAVADPPTKVVKALFCLKRRDDGRLELKRL